MNRYKIIISYDGTDYHGWQIQPKNITISKVLQDTFKSVFKKDIKIIGASRTDSGVHALGQVAKFDLDLNIKPEVILKAWNSVLPNDILIRSLEKVNIDFHPRKFVKEKIYYYNFSLIKPSPLISNYVYWLKQYNRLDLDKLNFSLNLFVGTHDFRSFVTGKENISTVKTINSIKLLYLKRFKIYQIQFRGQSFLRYMIRRITGAALKTASLNSLSISNLNYILNSCDPENNLYTAPALGLILRKILYTY